MGDMGEPVSRLVQREAGAVAARLHMATSTLLILEQRKV